MAFDGLVLKAVTKELTCLIGGKIQKIYEPDENEVLLSIYCNGLQYALSINISSNLYSVYLTTNKKVNPLIAPNFCMLLRKHLINYRINNIKTLGLERILIIELNGKDENNNIITKKLVVELMGKYSNILLLNSNDIIIDSFKHFSINNGSNRDIMPKFKYFLPTSDKIDIINFKNFKNIPKDSNLVDFFSSHFTGISKSSVKQIITESGVPACIENYSLIANSLLKLIDNIESSHVKCIDFEKKDYVLTSCNDKESLQVNMYLDDFYKNKQEKEQFLTYRNTMLNFIMAKLKKISKKLSTIDERLKECSQMETYKLYGELITNYLYQIPKQRLSHIELLNYYDNKMINIPLDVSILPVENAKKYFKKYNKLKNAISIVKEQKVELEKEINYLESIVYEIEISTCIEDIDLIYEEIKSSFSNNKKQKLKVKENTNTYAPISYSIDGFKVLIGRNNKQNDELTFKIANSNDIWFHVKDFHGSHVILLTNGEAPSQGIINKCAALAAFYSKATNSSNVPVDYTFVKNVKKYKNAKPGMVIYTSQETVNVQPKCSF